MWEYGGKYCYLTHESSHDGRLTRLLASSHNTFFAYTCNHIQIARKRRLFGNITFLLITIRSHHTETDLISTAKRPLARFDSNR